MPYPSTSSTAGSNEYYTYVGNSTTSTFTFSTASSGTLKYSDVQRYDDGGWADGYSPRRNTYREPTFAEKMMAAQQADLGTPAWDLYTITKEVFSSPNCRIAELVEPVYQKIDDHHLKPWSYVKFEPMVVATKMLINQLYQQLMLSIFHQSTIKKHRSGKDGNVIKEALANHPQWMIVSPKVAMKMKNDLSIMNEFGLQYLCKVEDKTEEKFTTSVYATHYPDLPCDFIITGKKSSLKFCYDIPFTVINGDLHSSSNFIVGPDTNIFLSIEV